MCAGIVLPIWVILPITFEFAPRNYLIFHDLEDNYTLFMIFMYFVSQHLKNWEAPVKLSWSTWKQIALLLAYLGPSGPISKSQSGCSKLLSCSDMASRFLIYCWYQYSQNDSKNQAWLPSKGLLEDQTNSFNKFSCCHSLACSSGYHCGYSWILYLLSCY